MSPILLVIVFLIVFTVLVSTYLWMSDYLALRDTLGFIPSPKSFPFIGHSWQISRIAAEDRFEWLNDLCLKYELGMVVTWLTIKPFVNIRKPQQIEIILKSSTYIAKSRMYKILRPWLGKGILTSTGNRWFAHKCIVTPTMHPDNLEQYISIMYKKVKITVKRLHTRVQKNSKSAINIFPIINRLAFDTVCEIATGIEMDTLRKSDNVYTRAMNTFCQIATDRYNHKWILWDRIFYLSKVGKKMLKSVKYLHSFTESIIERRQTERKEEQAVEDDNPNQSQNQENKSFLDHLLSKNESVKEPLSITEIREELDTFIFIGYNTITAAITWALFALGNAPHIQINVQNELKEILGEDDGPATIDQLSRLNYLDRVISEVFRIYPSVPIIGRSLNRHVVIDNYFIPQGTTINIQIYQLHHDPEIWDSPETFDPDRFRPENNNQRHPYSYIPFSDGPRQCIGQKFAFLQVKAVLSAILRKWCITSLLKPSEMKLTASFTLKPHDDKVELFFKPINKT